MMPTFTENAHHLQASNSLRLAVMELSKLGLIVRRFQSRGDPLIEIAPNEILEPESSTAHWHSVFIKNVRVCWSAAK